MNLSAIVRRVSIYRVSCASKVSSDSKVSSFFGVSVTVAVLLGVIGFTAWPLTLTGQIPASSTTTYQPEYIAIQQSNFQPTYQPEYIAIQQSNYQPNYQHTDQPTDKYTPPFILARPASRDQPNGEHPPGTVTLYDPFEDMDLLMNPPWSGDTAMFLHQTENINTFLQLQAPEGASKALLSTPDQTVFGSWSWQYQPGFQASNVNRAFLVLLSDSPDFNYLDGSAWNGYAIRTGENGDEKRFRLVRFDAGNQAVLLTGELAVEQGHWYQLTATRSPEGDWWLDEEDLTLGISARSGPVNDQTHVQSGFTGLFLRFTSGNRSAFRFDEFVIRNLQPFQPVAVQAEGSFRLLVEFSYPPDVANARPSMFLLDDAKQPLSVESIGEEEGQNLLRLAFDEPLSDGEHQLQVQGLMSALGDSVENGLISFNVSNPFQIQSSDFRREFVDVRFTVPPKDPATLPGTRVEINSSEDLLISVSDNDSLLWRFVPSTPLPAGESQIRFTGWTDKDGFLLTNPTVSGWVLDEATSRDVVINEFFYRVPAVWRTETYPRPAYIELLNRSGKLLNLKNWTLNGLIFQSETDLILQPGDFAVITQGVSVFYPIFGVQPYWEAEQFPGLPLTTPGIIVLRNDAGSVVDSLQYVPSLWGGDGVALEKIDPNTASADQSKWRPSEASRAGTPGVQNSVYQEDLDPPKPLIAEVLDEPASNQHLSTQYEPTQHAPTDMASAKNSTTFLSTSISTTINTTSSGIEIRFDEFVQASENTTMELDGVLIPAGQWELNNGRHLRVYSSEVKPAYNHRIRVRQIEDVAGNRLGEFLIPVAQPAGPGDLVIHELMADPLTDAFDGKPDQTEYIELKNTRGYALQMSGLQLRDLPDETGVEKTLYPVGDEDRWVPAYGYFVIYPEVDEVPFGESLFARAYLRHPDTERHSARIERSTLGLISTGKTIRLYGRGRVRMDSLTYSSSWHNPNVRQTKGRSLERLDAFAETNAGWNWGTSGGVTGGTPGEENSLQAMQPSNVVTHGVQLTPQVFSPDGDGRDDLLTISYQLPETDYLLRIRVYDEQGRRVRTVTEDLAAGSIGSVYWNGFDDYGLKARAGLYIIHTEAYNRAAGRVRYYKNAVAIAVPP